MFNKKEFWHLLVSILVLGFIFGFDDGAKNFLFINWISNLIWILFLTAIAVLFRELVIKLFARRHDVQSQYEIWYVDYLGFYLKEKKGKGFLNIFRETIKKPYPLGILFALILAVASNGKAFFTAVGVHNFKEIESARVGRKHGRMTYLEEAQIASSGIFASLFLAFLALLIGEMFNFKLYSFANINFYLALFNMIPLSRLDGAKIFFGSL